MVEYKMLMFEKRSSNSGHIKFLLFIFIIVCGNILLLEAQDSLLLPTGRSLPDTVPHDQIIYLGPVEEYRNFLQPAYRPNPNLDPSFDKYLADTDTDKKTAIPSVQKYESPQFAPVFEPEQNPNIPIVVELEPIKFIEKPSYIPESEPIEIVEKAMKHTDEIPNDAPAPSSNVLKSPSSNPSYVPKDEILKNVDVDSDTIPLDVVPDQQVAPPLSIPEYEFPLNQQIEPQLIFPANPPMDPIAVVPDETSWIFSLTPTEPQYPSVEDNQTIILESGYSVDKKHTIKDNEVVILENNTSMQNSVDNKQILDFELRKSNSKTDISTQLTTPVALNTNVVTSNLSNGQYIQLASYKDLNQARDKIESIMNEEAVFIVNNAPPVLYKSEGSSYYKILIGPYRLSEVGVRLYSLRSQGFKKAFAIKVSKGL